MPELGLRGKNKKIVKSCCLQLIVWGKKKEKSMLIAHHKKAQWLEAALTNYSVYLIKNRRKRSRKQTGDNVWWQLLHYNWDYNKFQG